MRKAPGTRKRSLRRPSRIRVDRKNRGGWNYRVVRSRNEHGETWFEIHEAYYNRAGELSAITENPIAPKGESMKELVADLQKMLRDCRQPVLEADGLRFAAFDCEADDQPYRGARRMSPEFFKIMDEMMAMHRRNRREAEKDPTKK